MADEKLNLTAYSIAAAFVWLERKTMHSSHSRHPEHRIVEWLAEYNSDLHTRLEAAEQDTKNVYADYQDAVARLHAAEGQVAAMRGALIVCGDFAISQGGEQGIAVYGIAHRAISNTADAAQAHDLQLREAETKWWANALSQLNITIRPVGNKDGTACFTIDTSAHDAEVARKVLVDARTQFVSCRVEQGGTLKQFEQWLDAAIAPAPKETL
jgi:hypothetical protein